MDGALAVGFGFGPFTGKREGALCLAGQFLEDFRFGFFVVIRADEPLIVQGFKLGEARLDVVRGVCVVQAGAHGGGHVLSDAGADADARTESGESAFVLRGKRDGLCGLVLGVAVQIADDAHADALVQRFLDSLRQGDAFDGDAFEGEAQGGKGGGDVFGEFLREQGLVRRHVKEGDA